MKYKRRDKIVEILLWLWVILLAQDEARAAIPIHISHLADEGSAIFNASIKGHAYYSLHPTLTTHHVKNLVEIDRLTGVIELKRNLNCAKLSDSNSNPFYLYIEYSSRTTDTYANLQNRQRLRLFENFHGLLPLEVHVHGGECRPRSNKRKDSKYEEDHTPRSATYISRYLVEYRPGTCWNNMDSILSLYDLLPQIVDTQCQPDFRLDGSTARDTFRMESPGGQLIVGGDRMCLNDESSWYLNLEMMINQHCFNKRNNPMTNTHHEVVPLELEIRAVSQTVDATSDLEVQSIRKKRQAQYNRSPQFSQPVFPKSVPENEASGYVVGTLTASDPDSGDNGRLSYRITADRDGRSQNMFHIDENTGVVTTTRILDREQIDHHYFQVTAEDHGSPVKRAYALLEIEVEDRNDHVPEFEMPEYYVEMDENQGISSVLEIHAIDEDAGSNGKIRYTILNPQPPNNIFSLNSWIGTLSTTQSLDREIVSRYELRIQAKDEGSIPSSLNSTALVVVTVLDTNDNRPEFSEPSYQVTVREDVDTRTGVITLVYVSAVDLDEGSNADVRYSMLGGNSQGRFAIDPLTGEITLTSNLDFESTPVYRLNIRAQDGGRPMRSQTTFVTVSVEDVNDNAPRFPTSLYQSSVREDVRPGYSIKRVTAFDVDSGDNGKITYSFAEPIPLGLPFEIDGESGQITNEVELDRETMEQWNFDVLASDHGSPPLTATTHITVLITDINDNPPEFTEEQYHAVVDEDTNLGTEIITVTAMDLDERNSISYQVTAGNTRNRFSVLSQNNIGVVSVALPLDFRQESRFVLTIEASDNLYTTSCLVFINVTDTNGYRPIFQQSPYTVSVPEDVDIGTNVVTVLAVDNDFGENARITYTMDNPQGVPEFTIDADTGEIWTLLHLDRETKSKYIIFITASDNGKEPLIDTTEVEIFVNDVNDNYPVFDEPSYVGEVSEGASIHFSVLHVSASDDDEGTNSQVSYRFREGKDGNGAFIIDDTSGVIRVGQRLDRETVPVYNLIVEGEDGGGLVTPVDVTITLQDENDNAPSFPRDTIDASIDENQNPGHLVKMVTATDPDYGRNAVISYTLEDGDMNVFEINGFNGALTTLMILNYEEREEYYVKVRATSSPYFSDVDVYIHVLDVNDNAPILNDFDIVFNNYLGHFPEGDIGTVPAYDPDVSDTLEYTIISGNPNSHLILNETTGGIRLNPTLSTSDIPQKIPFRVSVTDGINEVQAMCNFRLTMVTEDMLYNSVTIQLGDITKEDFLAERHDIFIQALATIIPASSNYIYLFSVREVREDNSNTILNVTFAAKSADSSFFSSQYLQERIYLKRDHLASVAVATVLPFGDNLCLQEICSDYDMCVSTLSFWTPGDFIATDRVIFRSIHPETIYKCDCPLGFSGNYCNTEINFCYSNPCKNTGECVQREGGYTCICKEGFTGINCEIDYANGRCNGHDDVCKNGGSCINYILGGMECSCLNPKEYEGPFCEMRTRNFHKGSFMTFWSLNQRVRLQIKLSFATQQQNGLLFYNGRYNHQNDFIALEILNGEVQFSFSLGQLTSTVLARIPGGVTDGAWHTVQVEYHETKAKIIIDDCDSSVALQHGSRLGDYSCAAEIQQHGKRRFLNLNGPFILGGLPSLTSEFPVTNLDFEGCIRDVYIDNNLLDLSTNLVDFETSASCGPLKDFCASDPCHAGGTCVNEWNRYVCHCAEGLGGVNCNEAISMPSRLSGTGVMTFEPALASVNYPWQMRIGFRTRAINGVLMELQLDGGERMNLFLSNGFVKYRFRNIRLNSEVTVNDGHWHDVELMWQNDELEMSLDYDKHVITTTLTEANHIEGKSVSSLNVGGNLDAAGNVNSGFRGCVQGMSVGGLPLDRDDATRISNVLPSCDVEETCGIIECPKNSKCIDKWETQDCICNKGYYGPQCVSACSLGVCHHGQPCVMTTNSERGYRCDCSDDFFGDHCEKRVELCPEDFWGFQICGPCECDEDRGFNSDCNKTTGECYCQENSYRPAKSDTCYPCNCYNVGSESQSCHSTSGQCECKRGVIGQRCDACVDPFAEVTIRGCEVVYDSCPKRYAENLWWPRTKFGREVELACPGDTTGYATRYCSFENNWEDAFMFNCTHSLFDDLNTPLDTLESGTPLNPAESYKYVRMLYEATNSTDFLYGNDILLAYKLLVMLLRHESKQEGVNVTAAIQSSFTRKIVEITSRLLDPVNKVNWREIQKTYPGTVEIMKLLESFGATIAKTSNSYTYTPEFSVESPNVIMHHDIIVRENFSTIMIPQGTNDNKLISHIHLPGDSILPKPSYDDAPLISVTSNVAVSSFIQYSSIGNLLPNTSDDSVVKSRGKVGQIINTPVVSLTLYDEQLENSGFRHELETPVILEMSSNDNVNRSGLQCMFWNFTLFNGTGGWSTDGCEVVGYNRTHINCSCIHLSNFAVIMDNAPYTVYQETMISLMFVTYGGVGLGGFFLLATFLVLLCLPNLHSNLNSIHINFVFILIASFIIFLVGINTKIVYACTIVAIGLHFLVLSAFGWMLIEGIHLYRMMTEVRNINQGPMSTYYIFSYGVPGIIVGLSVPLSNVGYGAQINAEDQYFCWLSVTDILIWSFAGPVLGMVAMNVVVFIMAISTSLRSSHKDPEFNSLKTLIAGLRAAGILLPLLGITWVFGLLAVNQGMLFYELLFAFCSVVLGVSIFIFYCLLDAQVRDEVLRCCFHIPSKKSQFDSASSRSALSYSKETPSKYNIGISTGSMGGNSSRSSRAGSYHPNGFVKKTASTTTASPSANFDYAPPYYKPQGPTDLDGQDESDSDSEVSGQRNRDSMSLASSHSSDEDEAADIGDWKKLPPKSSLPDTLKHVPMHSTPKGHHSSSDSDRKKKQWPGEPITKITEADRRSGIGQRAELKILDPKLPHIDDKGKSSPTGSGGSGGSGSVESHTRIPMVSQRPDILPLKGIMKKPKPDNGGLLGSGGSNMGSNLSLTKRIPQIVSSQEKIAVIINNHNGDSDGSNETSV